MANRFLGDHTFTVHTPGFENTLKVVVEESACLKEGESARFALKKDLTLQDRVMNAHLKVGDTDLMLSDTFPGQPYQIGSQVTVAITVDSVEESKEVFEKLKEGGQIGMPLQETFWSPSYGQVTDKFGVTWQVSTQIDNTE